MVSNSFQQTTPKRRAAWLALLAILLIVVAPLISVSLQRPHERHARHAPRHDDG